MALDFEPTMGESIGSALYDPTFGLNPLVGVGIGALGARTLPAILKKYFGTKDGVVAAWAADANKLGLYGAGATAAIGAAMLFGSPKTKEAGLATIVAALAAGPVGNWLTTQIIPGVVAGSRALGATRRYPRMLGQGGYPRIQGGVGAIAMESTGGLGNGTTTTAPPMDVLSGAFGSNFMSR